MNARRLLVFLVVVCALFGCRRSRNGQLVVNVPAVVAATVIGGGNVLLDPLATTRVLVGLLTIQNDTAIGTESGDIDYQVDCPPGCEADSYNGRLAPGEQVQVQVFTTLLLATAITVNVIARYVAGGDARTFPVAWANLTALTAAFTLVSLLDPSSFGLLWYASAVLAPIGVLTANSNPNVPPRVPALAQEVRLFGALVAFLTAVQLVELFGGLDDGPTVFPPGQGANGFTVAATPFTPVQAGEFVAFYLSVADDIPLQSPDELLQYAFVCDSDANPANNYVPAPAFPNDFFADTDRWYVLDYTPQGGWRLECRVVAANNTVSVVASGAHAVIQGDTLMVVVPRSEFVVSNPPFRATTFAHLGDFGQNPPFTWSGDPTPTVAEGLHSWQ